MSIEIPEDFGVAYDEVTAGLNLGTDQALLFIYRSVARPAFKFALETEEKRPLVVLGALLSSVVHIGEDEIVKLNLRRSFKKDTHKALAIINSSVMDASHEMLGSKIDANEELELPQGDQAQVVDLLGQELRYRVAVKLAENDLFRPGVS